MSLRTAEYAEAPLFAFLKDSKVDARARLAFAPYVAHFVLTFGDLCRYLLPREPAQDRLQELVNANAVDDQNHWQWYLADLEQLGWDARARLSDSVKMLWSRETARTRMLSYRLCHWAQATDSAGRLVLVECAEAAFKVTMKHVQIAAGAFQATTGKKLRYLGVDHAAAETTHAMDEAGARRFMERLELTPQAVQDYGEMVDAAFRAFRDFADEMLELAMRHGAKTLDAS